VGEGLLTYIIASQFFENNFDYHILLIIAAVILTLTFFNIRMSRMIWMYALNKNYSM